MAIKTMDDIEREKRNEQRFKFKKEMSEDVNDILGNIFGKPKAKTKKTWTDRVIDVLKILGILLLILIIINIVLGNIWLLRFFLKSLFGLG